MKYTAEDRKWSRMIRAKFDWRCQRCGRQFDEDNARGLDCAHIFTRGTPRTRTDPDNGIPLCMGCHYIFDGKGARGMTREEKRAFARSVLGDDVFDALVLRTHVPKKRVKRPTTSTA